MQVNRVATMMVESCKPHETVSSVAERMRWSEVGLLPVLVQDEHVSGVITDRDIVTKCVGAGLDPVRTYAKDIMSQPVVWIYEDAELDEALRLMAENNVRRILVKDHKQRAAGVLSLDDVALFTNGDHTVGRVLERIARGTIAAAKNPDFYDMVD